MRIRAEEEKDRTLVHEINAAVFGTQVEANLVDALRKEARPIISLVADDGQTIVGYILFSPVSLTGHPGMKIMGLAPMAVAPAHQRKGVGSALVRSGLERCRQLGFGAAVVLGHPEYYPRFGFAPASRLGIQCEYDVPDNVFLAMELEPGYLAGRSGTIKYHGAFGKA